MFESRRFVELRKQGFWKQFFSAESTGMGIFYTLNVFCIQARPPLVMQSLLAGPNSLVVLCGACFGGLLSCAICALWMLCTVLLEDVPGAGWFLASHARFFATLVSTTGSEGEQCNFKNSYRIEVLCRTTQPP